ncbi:MAG: hypothetical protein WA633_17990 [Stellaceae bacterium]
MIIRDFAEEITAETRITSATVVWEEQAFADQELYFEIYVGDRQNSDNVDESWADAFLTGCFPLAAVHGEARVRIESPPCPMLVEGLQTVHTWWKSWGGISNPAPAIESPARGRPRNPKGPRRAICCISGGVDGLHMLMRNRRVYSQADPAYIREGLFIHGFDIGKRARDPENERFRAALQRLEPLAAETGIKIVPCRTNLRHLPSKPDFWTHRQNVSALAAVGHAAAYGPNYLLIAGAYNVENPVPMGSHPAVDGLFSSQRITVVHEGARFSRVEKVRELASWPTALAALRVCPANVGNKANCGVCEKCLGTRLELLAADIEETEAFGPSLTPVELWEAAVPMPSGHRALRYEDLLPFLWARGQYELCRVLENKIAIYRQRVREGMRWPGL